MYKFTSPLTHRKLLQHKSFQVPDFEYSSLNEIDYQYQEFCKQSRQELFCPKKQDTKNSSKFSLKTVSEDFEKSRRSQEVEMGGSKETKLNFLKDRMIDVYKNQKKTVNNLGVVNPVVDMFGNAVIAAFFQSLIIKTVEDVFELEIDDPLTFSNQVLENFGITHGQMKNLKSLEEKRRFILDNMGITIDRLLKGWNEKLEIQERHYTQAENQYESIKREHFKDCGDSLKWLIVRTKYQALDKKLKTLIVQKLNDYENQVKVLELLKQRQMRRQSSQKIASTDLKITLNNVNQPLTSDMLKHNILAPDDMTSKRTISSPKAPRSLMQSPMATISFNLGHKRGQSVKNFARKSIFNDWKFNQAPDSESSQLNNFLTEEIHKKNIHDIKEKDLFEFTWDEDLESIFKVSKKTAKSLFIHEKNNGKWNSLAFKSIVQKLFTEEKKNKERSQLLKIYSEGGLLTTDEFRFLSDTSELLNSCIDKKFFQNAVNIIDPNILHFMELNLAEQIIKQHKAMEEIVMLARKEFYKSKNELILSRIAYHHTKNSKEMATQRNKDELLKKQKVFIFAMGKFDRKEKERKSRKDEKLYKDINNCRTSYNDYEKEMYKEIEANSMRRLELKKKLCEPKNLIGFQNQNHPSIVKHRFHPSSKLFYLDKKEMEEKKNVELFLKTIRKNEEEYKVNITSPQVLRMPHNFKNFYSGGPTPLSNQNLFDPVTYEPLRPLHKNELKCISKIQAKMRGFLERKRHTERVEEQIKKHFIEMSDKVSMMRDLTLNQTMNDHNKTSINNSQTGVSFLGSSFTKTHKKINSLSTDYSASGRASFKNYKFRQKSVKNEDLFEKSKKLGSFNNNLSFFYSKKEINVQDNAKNTPLYYAAKNGNMDFCEYLLENGGNPNDICSFGDTPFHIAIKTKRSEVISLFLKYDPDFTIQNEKNETPLDVCNERTLEVFNLKKQILAKSTKSEGYFETKGRESRLHTEKSGISTPSETKIKKTLSFRKKLVDVI